MGKGIQEVEGPPSLQIRPAKATHANAPLKNEATSYQPPTASKAFSPARRGFKTEERCPLWLLLP